MTQLLASVFESWGGGGTVFFYQTEPFEKCLYSSHHGVLLLQGSLSFLTLNDSALRLYISKKYHTMDLMDIFQTNVEHLRLILPRRPFCPMQWACGVHVVKIQSYITRGVCMYMSWKQQISILTILALFTTCRSWFNSENICPPVPYVLEAWMLNNRA